MTQRPLIKGAGNPLLPFYKLDAISEFNNLTSEQKEALLTTSEKEFRKFDWTRDKFRLFKKMAQGGDMKAKDSMKQDNQRAKEKAQLALLEKKYKEALKQIQSLEKQVDITKGMEGTISTYKIIPKVSGKASEATCVWVASDWHVEESVSPATISGLNEYGLDIAKKRAERFFQAGLRLTDILAKDVTIKTVILALLGDFISNDIHDELVEGNEIGPMDAAINAQNMIASGIEFVLKNSKYDLVIPCHSGNHARTTDKTRFSTENAHSIEYMMFNMLAGYFRREPRVKFLISPGYHQYLQVYGLTIRFHHGHSIRYGGGVGGIYIPTNKAIAQWNKARWADLDVFGHFHQFRDGGNFVCNGSMIGYNAFALSIKADYEKPKQALFLLDSKRGRTATWPILFE